MPHTICVCMCEEREREREREFTKRSNICRKFEAIIQNYSQIEQLKFAFQY